jgi:hypothetical protein
VHDQPVLYTSAANLMVAAAGTVVLAVSAASERRDKEPFTPFSIAFRPLRPLQPWLFHQA